MAPGALPDGMHSGNRQVDLASSYQVMMNTRTAGQWQNVAVVFDEYHMTNLAPIRPILPSFVTNP